MDPVKLPRIAAAPSEAADDGAIRTGDDADFVVLSVRTKQIALLGIRPDRNVPNRAIAERVLFEEPFLDEGAVLPKDLDPVVDAVADIDEPVIGDLHAMHRVRKLLRTRRLGIVGRLLVV